MAVTGLTTATLSEALTAETNDFTVSSTASITVGQYLVIQGTGGLEAVKVQEIPVSGRVKVMRGVGGTKARGHISGSRFFIGDPDDFRTQRGSALGALDGLLGANGTTLPEYMFPGLRATDGIGNEYVLVDLTATIVQGATVLISKDGLFTASVITSTSVGSVGVLTESGTSDQYVWAQIYGRVDHAKLVGGSSLVSSLGEFGGASSVSTPSVGLVGRSSSQRSSDYLVASTITGMFPASAASTASTSASSETGLFAAAWLNYPYIERALTT